MIRKQRIAHLRPRFKVNAHLPLRSPQLCSCTAVAWNAGPSAQQTRDHWRVRELHLRNQAVGQIVLPLTTNGVASAGYLTALSLVFRVRKTIVPASQNAWESNEVMDVTRSTKGTLWALMCVTWLCYTTTTSAAAPRLLREAEAEGQEEGGASRLVTRSPPWGGKREESNHGTSGGQWSLESLCVRDCRTGRGGMREHWVTGLRDKALDSGSRPHTDWLYGPWQVPGSAPHSAQQLWNERIGQTVPTPLPELDFVAQTRASELATVWRIPSEEGPP